MLTSSCILQVKTYHYIEHSTTMQYHQQYCKIHSKLDGVGPVDNRLAQPLCPKKERNGIYIYI